MIFLQPPEYEQVSRVHHVEVWGFAPLYLARVQPIGYRGAGVGACGSH